MAEQSTIKQISIGENEYEIDAKYWGGRESSILDNLASRDYVDGKIFVGTMNEYEDSYNAGSIGVGSLVIIMEENGGDANSGTTSKLGKAVLGQMKLG